MSDNTFDVLVMIGLAVIALLTPLAVFYFLGAGQGL
jgi:hypothetical protein